MLSAQLRVGFYPGMVDDAVTGSPIEGARITLQDTVAVTDRGVRFKSPARAARSRRDGSVEVRTQIDAAEEFSSDGWMLWNPRNQYSAGGLNPEATP